MATVTFEGVSRVHPATRTAAAFRALDELDLQIDDGEFLVLVGPSGSGKSTALRTLAGLDPIDSGAIRIAGDDVSRVPPRDRDIAMVFQSYALYPHMTVARNMAFPLRRAGLSRAEIGHRIETAARMLELTALLHRRPAALSGGQRQRVAMARAVVREPAVFLLDEPLSNLDARLRVDTRAALVDLQRRLGTTTIHVTHDQVEAMTMGHRVAVLHDGRLQQVGTPRDIYDRPQNTMVAGFVGSPAMTLHTVPLCAEGVRVDELLLPVPREVRARAGEQVTVGLRPEALSCVGPDAPGARLVVDLVEDTGLDRHAYGHVPDDPTRRLVVRLRDLAEVPVGSTLRVAPADRAAIHFFDAVRGGRLCA